MKILHDSRKKPWKLKYTCTRCDSRLELEASDLGTSFPINATVTATAFTAQHAEPRSGLTRS